MEGGRSYVCWLYTRYALRYLSLSFPSNVSDYFTTSIKIAHAAYFSVFEAAKSMTGADKTGHYPMQAAFSGSIASLSHDLFITPFDLVKQRMQLGYYDSTLHCLKSIVRSEGIRALYVSFPTTVVMNIPYGAVMVAVNESSRKILDPSGGYSLTTSMTAGSIAGAIAAAITNPLDVIKTRLQTQNLQSCPRCSDSVYSSPSLSSSSKAAATCVPNRKKSTLKMMHFDNLFNSTIRDSMYYNGLKNGVMGIRSNSSNRMDIQPNSKTSIKGILQIVTTILAEEGLKGFLRGIVPRVLSHAPSVAISWTAYEAMKSILSRA